MINCLIKTAALLCPTATVISPSQGCHRESTLMVLKQLQIKLDRALEHQYEQKVQAVLSKKTNVEEINNTNRSIR